jgi:hypothetical protein
MVARSPRVAWGGDSAQGRRWLKARAFYADLKRRGARVLELFVGEVVSLLRKRG